VTIQLPEYVEYGPRETSPPPFSAGSGRFLGLILKGDLAVIGSLCDKVLNKPFETSGEPTLTIGPFSFGRRAASPYTFEPLSDVVLLFAGAWHGLRSLPVLGAGSANEEQVSLWIPVKRRNLRTGEESICMIVPYMFVDNPMSLLNGREDYGYQKAFAFFGGHEKHAYPGEEGVRAFGGLTGTNNVAAWLDVMKVVPVGSAGPPADADPGSGTPSGQPFSIEVLIEILENGVDQVFLKQFRDAEQAGKSCYQHLVEARVRFVKPKVEILLEQWQVELMIPDKSSHPIGEDLGIAKTTVTPFSFTLTSELELEEGKIIV
jgi:hypothetical protein